MIKHFAKRLIEALVLSTHGWRLINSTLIPLARHAQWEKERADNALAADSFNLNDVILRISPQLQVLHGPFYGMRYPSLESAGSALAPKILGSYERELHYLLYEFIKRDYSDIIDVGCAEGYYAVGMALRMPNARVFGFDTNPRALELCRRMAELNGVGDRVTLGEGCDSTILRSFRECPRALIICDCEGFEKFLFTREVAMDLVKHDILLEVHDFIDINISTHLRKVFHGTHEIEIVQSIDDIQKVNQYDYKELEGFGRELKKKILGEYRPSIMEWYYLRAGRFE